MPKLICNECEKELDYEENEFTYHCECGGSLEKVFEEEDDSSVEAEAVELHIEDNNGNWKDITDAADIATGEQFEGELEFDFSTDDSDIDWNKIADNLTDVGYTEEQVKGLREEEGSFVPTVDNLEEGDIFVEEVNRGPIRNEGILKVINKNEDIVKLGFLDKSTGKAAIVNKDYDSLNQAITQTYNFYRKATPSERGWIEAELEDKDGQET